MLKLTRGTEVEMLSKKEADVFGAWVCAEVITSTAYTCTVKYVDGSGDGIVEEIVPREAVSRAGPMNFGALGETLKFGLIFLFTF
jgi:hypothetical protein